MAAEEIELEDEQDLLNMWREVIDYELARNGLHVSKRPIYATIELVNRAILQIRDGDMEFEPSGDFSELMHKSWFKKLHKTTAIWYRDRYGSRIERPESTVIGIIPIYAAIYELEIPTRVTERAEEPHTVWTSWPGSVLPDEDPLTWIISGPNLSTMPDDEYKRTRKLAYEISSALRFINSRMMGIKADQQVAELRGGILPHIERAAKLIASSEQEQFKQAYWEMQMACELALKMLAQQRSGSFIETHDLFILYDRMPGDALPFKRDQLKKLPNWETMAELRYGRGRPVSFAEVFAVFRATLKIVAGTISGVSGYDLTKARFKLQAPPWELNN